MNIHILGIIWILVIVIGSIISLIHSKTDKRPTGKKQYQVGILNHIAKLNFSINLLLISIVAFGLGIFAFLMIFKSFYVAGICGIILIICGIIAGYNSVLAILLHIQYYRFEKSTRIECDSKKREIVFKNTVNKESMTLHENQISIIEVHQCLGNLKKPTAEYEYIRFKNNFGQDYIITSLQTNILNLTDIFKNKKKKYIYKKINWLE